MSNSRIPDTSNSVVAIIAAALELTLHTSEPDDTLEKKLHRFIKAYGIADVLATQGTDEARARLAKEKSN
jgi:hypothetical protein